MNNSTQSFIPPPAPATPPLVNFQNFNAADIKAPSAMPTFSIPAPKPFGVSDITSNTMPTFGPGSVPPSNTIVKHTTTTNADGTGTVTIQHAPSVIAPPTTPPQTLNYGQSTTPGQQVAGTTVATPPASPVVNDPNFNVNPINNNGAVSSSALGNRNSYQDVLNTRNNFEQGLLEAYNDPNVVAARNALAGAQSGYTASQVNMRNNIFDDNTNPNATQDSAKGFINADMTFGQHGVDQALLKQNVYANTLNAATGNQANVIAGYGALLGKTNEDISNMRAAAPAAVGAPQVDPQTGNIYINQRDPITGQTKTVMAGSMGSQNQYTAVSQPLPDPYNPGQYVINAIKQDGTQVRIPVSSSGQILGGGSGTQGGNSGQPFTTNNGGTLNQMDSSKVSQIAQSIKPFVWAGPKGVAYVNGDQVPDALKDAARIQAANAGIPFLQGGDVAGMQSLLNVYQSVQNMQKLTTAALGSGIGGSIAGSTINQWAKALGIGNGPLLTTFDSFRTTAVKSVQALAGGQGSGLKINVGEIAAAAENLPTSKDNLEKANAKLQAFEVSLDTQLQSKFPTITASQPYLGGNPTGVGSQSSGTVQTKSGAVNTNW